MISENIKFLQNTTSYSKEQLLVMNYFKKKDYDFRLSWKKKDKTNRNIMIEMKNDWIMNI